MTGKTHLAVGTAAALCVTQPPHLRDWVLCIGAAVVGSVISDVDVSTSDSREALNKITAVSCLAFVVVVILECIFHLGILKNFNRESSLFRFIIGFAVMLIVCTFGKNQPHRSFMHSILGLLIFSGIVAFMYPEVELYFAIAMLSHILIDLLNKRKVRLLYPWGNGWCLRRNSQYVVILVGFGSGDDCFLLAGSFKICAGIIKDVTITEIKLELSVLY